MAKNVCLILLSFLFVACSDSDEIKIPANILSKEKMAEVLLDIHLLEATLNLNAGNVNKNPSEEKLGVDIYKKHNITKEQFEESYKFYTENPSALTEVYDKVLSELSKLQASVGHSK